MMRHCLARVPFGVRLLLLAVLLLAGAGLLSPLKTWRIDLTENQLYTLSTGSRNIIASVHEPITLKFYYSEALVRDVPMLRNYANRVEELLREYVRYSNGKIVLEVIHPAVFSEEEDAAAAAGLQAIPDGRGNSIYLGLSGSRGDRTEAIALFNPQKENLLEYQISQLLYRLNRAVPLTVGVISEVPMFRSIDPKTRGLRQDWLIVNQMRQLFDIRRQIDPSVDKIDDDLNLLIVVHPNKLPEKTLFAIDQFVLRGGRLLVFVDPLAETDESEAKLLGEGFADRSSDLDPLFKAWGVNYDASKVILDLGSAHSIPVERGGQAVPHVGILSLEGDAINREQNVIADLENVNIASAGALSQAAGSSTQFVPLLFSSKQTDVMDVQQYATIGNHAELLGKMKPSDHRYVFAAWVSGAVKTAFPAGKPADSHFASTPLTESREPIQVIVVADTDLLTDRMWVDSQDYYGQIVATPFAGNGDMVVNMVDALGGSTDLISLRSRGSFKRPFTRVDALEKAASNSLREQQDALTQALNDTEKKITALNAPAQEGAEAVASGLTPEQQQALTQFQQEKLRIRKKLRDVQHQLDADVDRLGRQLKVINIVTVPLLLTLVALMMAWWRRRRA